MIDGMRAMIGAKSGYFSCQLTVSIPTAARPTPARSSQPAADQACRGQRMALARA
jgi:hypothetical protein